MATPDRHDPRARTFAKWAALPQASRLQVADRIVAILATHAGGWGADTLQGIETAFADHGVTFEQV